MEHRERPEPCLMCGTVVTLDSYTTGDSEAPEMLRAPPDAFLGLVSDGDVSELLVICDAACLSLFLAE